MCENLLYSSQDAAFGIVPTRRVDWPAATEVETAVFMLAADMVSAACLVLIRPAYSRMPAHFALLIAGSRESSREQIEMAHHDLAGGPTSPDTRLGFWSAPFRLPRVVVAYMTTGNNWYVPSQSVLGRKRFESRVRVAIFYWLAI